MKTIKKGSKGADVKMLQSCLHLELDGIFGTVTEEAVKKFQYDNNLTPDGIVGVATWAKLTPLYKARLVNDIILHCAATPEGKDYTVADIDRWHKQRGWSKIGYHYVIYRDGSVNKGRDESLVGAHCENHNAKTIGICYIGGLDASGKKAKDTRTKALTEAMFKLVKKLLDKYNLSLKNVHCHNDYNKGKACPSFKRETFINGYREYFSE